MATFARPATATAEMLFVFCFSICQFLFVVAPTHTKSVISSWCVFFCWWCDDHVIIHFVHVLQSPDVWRGRKSQIVWTVLLRTKDGERSRLLMVKSFLIVVVGNTASSVEWCCVCVLSHGTLLLRGRALDIEVARMACCESAFRGNSHPHLLKACSWSSKSFSVCNPTTISVCGCEISFSSSARNPGFYIRDDMSVELHIKNVCRSAYSELRRISTIRHLLSVDSTKTLASAFVLSRLDYRNSLLSGCPKHLLEKLQKV